MKPVVLSQLAESDLDAIWEFIALDSTDAADRVLGEIEKAFLNLSRNPTLGHFREDLADKRHRFLLVFSYLIVYRVDAEALSIARVLHGARDVRALLADARGDF